MLARSPTVHKFNAPLKAFWLKQKEEQRLKDLERDRKARAGQFGALAEEDSDDDEQEPTKLDIVSQRSPKMAHPPKMSEKEKAMMIGFRNGTLSWADVESDDEFDDVEF
jgi:hypothetical protein